MAGMIGPGRLAWSTSILGTRSSGRWRKNPAVAKRGWGSR